MAYNRNGQPPGGQFTRYPINQPPPSQYASNHDRRASFASGDDAIYLGSDGNSSDQSPNPNAGGFVRMPDGADFGGRNHHHDNLATQPYLPAQNHPPRAPAAYNPQQYASTAHYGAPGPSSPTLVAPPSAQHQPYNPAAYQSATSPSTGYGFPAYESSVSRRPVPAQSPPEVPPRPWLQQGQPQQQNYGYPGQQPGYQQHYQSQPPPQSSSGQSGSSYTPPAPPPPPTGLSAYYNSQIPASTPLGQEPYGRRSRYENEGGPPSHPLPSLPAYPGANDSSTQPAPYPTSPKQSYSTSPQRSATSGRHPQARPLPAEPPAPYEQPDEESDQMQSFGYDDILQEVEAAVMGRPTPAIRRESTPKPERAQSRQDEDPLFSGRQQGGTRQNGVSSGIDVNYQAYSDESDAEAAAGLAAMQMAEEQDAADRAWRTGSQSRQNSLPTAPPVSVRRQGTLPPLPTDHGTSSDSDQIPIDMDTYGGGGISGNLSFNYGYDSNARPANNRAEHSHTPSAASIPYSDLSDATSTPGIEYYMPGEEAIHPFPPFARTDLSGTGGLSEPGQFHRKMSFEEGDEATLYDPQDTSSGAGTPSRDTSRSRASSRPLPHVPRRGAIDHMTEDEPPGGYSPEGDAYSNYGASAAVQKAKSVSSYGHTTLVVPPGRSATDAEQRRRLHVQPGKTMDENLLSPESAHAPRDRLGEIVLPSLPAGKRGMFVPSKLSSHDYKRCPEPWALSAVLSWLQEMTEGEADLKEQLIIDGLVALFTHKVPTMNTADAENLAAELVEQMFEEHALLHDEEWVKFSNIPMSGVVYQLTGTGCYSPMVHTHSTPGRCYAHHCMRTLKKVDLATQDLPAERKVEDWATFYKLKKDDIVDVNKKEIERQNNLHEIITSEDVYMDQLDVLRVLYRDGLKNSPQAIISPERVDDFIKEVFSKVDAVKRANEEYLLPQLKYRQEEQGPWIKGFSDIFREWIRKAKAAYIDYAGRFPAASLRMRKEADRNILFRQFLDQMRENERSKRLGWDTYLKSPITRLQRYSLLLATVHKHTVIENEEKKNLMLAIEEIKSVTLECDARVAEMQKRADLMELSAKLKLRPGMEKVHLNLNHLGREVIFRGDLQRKSSNKFSWVDTHAILFDHFMVLAKPVQQRDAAGGIRHEIYDISKLPIPMDLLVLESTNDDPVMKSAVKGITTATNRAQTPQDSRLGRATSNSTGASSSQLSQQPTNSSMSVGSGNSRNIANQTVLADSANDKILYPFRVKHLGKHETYVLYATSSGNRQDWCDSIIEAKTRHASALYAQNAEPFRLRVLADTAFNYDSSYQGPATVVIKGTPLDRSIEECDKSFYGTGPRANPVCRATVHCSTSFQPPFGSRMMAVGTDFGVFLSEYSNPRGWVRCAAITVGHVTQIAVLEDFSLFLILADKALIAYNLDSICPPGNGGPPPSADARKPPQKLSGSKDVGFFAIGRQKDRTLVFYKKKEGINSNFKVLEPVYTRNAATSRSRFGLKKGNTDYCRDFDEFYIPSDTFTINLFDKSLAVSTAKGIEVLTLDKKVPFSIPDLRGPAVASIAARLKDNDPLGMFRLNDNEFLLVFEGVGIYVDKHGDVSRAVVMEFVGRAKQAALYMNKYLILIDKGAGFVEVRNAINGRLRQVVSGRDVRLIDDGSSGGTIKICLQHPERERVQLVVELMVNDGQKE